MHFIAMLGVIDDHAFETVGVSTRSNNTKCAGIVCTMLRFAYT